PPATARAWGRTARGSDAESAVTASARSPRTSWAAHARYVESTPPEHATTADPRSCRTPRSRCSITTHIQSLVWNRRWYPATLTKAARPREGLHGQETLLCRCDTGRCRRGLREKQDDHDDAEGEGARHTAQQ